jgi:hypothetical protein
VPPGKGSPKATGRMEVVLSQVAWRSFLATGIGNPYAVARIDSVNLAEGWVGGECRKALDK